MIQVLKCDYCTHFTQDAEEMRIHEIKCSFNPNTKKCWTCANRFEEGAPISGFWNECKKGLQCHDNDGDCSEWEEE